MQHTFHTLIRGLALATSLIAFSFVRAQGNDDCSLATPQALAIGSSIVLTGDNSAAIGIGDFVMGSPYDGAPVYWVKFSTTACAYISISYCGQNPVWANTLGILANSCPADQLVNASAFNDADCGDGNRTYYFDQLPAGTWALPVLNDPGSNSSGAFSITVSSVACPVNNDFCSNVIPEALASGSTINFNGDNSSAGGINDFDPNSPYFGAPVSWHAFTTTGCNNVRVAYCGTTPSWSNVLGILATDCPALNLVNTSALNTADCGDGNTTFFYDALPAGTYYLPVLNDPGNNSSGPYTIQVSASACPVDNDFCANVVPEALPSGGSLTFNDDNSTAGSTNDFDPNSPYFGAPVKWHAFTIPGCNNVRVEYCGTTPAWGNVLGILATDCPALNLVNASSLSTVDCGDGNTTFGYDALPAGTYYLPVLNDVNSGSSGPYSIQVSASACPVNNDLCFGLPSDPLPVGGALVFAGDNSNATGDNDFVPGNPFGGAPVTWHLFTTVECADVSVAYCGHDPVWGTTFGWLTPDCPADSLIFFTTFSDDTCGDGNRTYYWVELPPGTYAVPIVLDPANGSVGAYSVLVSAEACLSTGTMAASRPDWSIYPNPTAGGFTITCSTVNSPLQIEVFDALGRSIRSEELLITDDTRRTIQRSFDMTPGQYVVRLVTTRGSSVQQLLVR